MSKAIVKLWGRIIGAVYQESIDAPCVFQYTPEFVTSHIEIAPFMMPLSHNPYSFPKLDKESFSLLPGLLADSLPDRYGKAMIEAYLESKNNNQKSFSSIEKLCYIGTRGMGALEYEPALDEKMPNDSINIDKLIDLANDVLNKKKKIKGSLLDIINVGTSAGGARAKAIVAYNEVTGEFRSGQIDNDQDYTYWIIKLDGVNKNLELHQQTQEYTRIEYAYYLMAKAAGINMSECRLYPLDNHYHFMTKRFDRYVDDHGKVHKYHMQTLAALYHLDYNQPYTFSYENTARVMRQLNLTQKEIEQFYRRMIFNVLAVNKDDHVKNISFLMDMTGKWTLSPMYDVTYAYEANNQWISHHQMLINGKNDDFTLDDLMLVAEKMSIQKSKAQKIIDEVSLAISQFSSYATQAQLSSKVINAIQKEKNKIQQSLNNK
ncbi:MAG: type II toxin-antitoxin system HipA family toxin [Bacilli bacterium]